MQTSPPRRFKINFIVIGYVLITFISALFNVNIFETLLIPRPITQANEHAEQTIVAGGHQLNTNERAIAAENVAMQVEVQELVLTARAGHHALATQAAKPNQTSQPIATSTLAPTLLPSGILFTDTFDDAALDGWYVFAGQPVVKNGALQTTSELLTMQLDLPPATHYTTHLQLSAVDPENCRGGFNLIYDFDVLLQLLHPETQLEGAWQVENGKGWEFATKFETELIDACQWQLVVERHIERQSSTFSVYTDGVLVNEYSLDRVIEQNTLILQFPNTMQLEEIEVQAVLELD